MAPKKTARSPKKRSSESSVLAPRAPPNPKRHPKIPWGEPKNSQTAPRGPQGAPLEPQRTTRDHRGTARELPRNPPGPQGPQESLSFFPPSFLPSLCKLLPTTCCFLMILGYVYTFPTCCLPASFFFEKLQALYLKMAPKRTPQALQQPSTLLPFCEFSP